MNRKSKILYFTGDTDPLGNLPELYYVSGDIAGFMEKAYPWIRDFCSTRLNRDPDIVSDFCVHFYERANRCLEKYRDYLDHPFTGFLATYLRHEFYNFIRGYRRRLLPEQPLGEIARDPGQDLHPYGSDESNNSYVNDFIKDALQILPVRLRLPLRLYYGLDVDRHDLRELYSLSGNATNTALFLSDFRKRQDSCRRRLRSLKDRSAYLNHLIHSMDEIASISGRAEIYLRWKRRIRESLDRPCHLYSLAELSSVFGLSKSTVARRIRRALLILSDPGEREADPPVESLANRVLPSITTAYSVEPS